MSIVTDSILKELTAEVRLAEADTTLTARRVRFSKMKRLYDRLTYAIIKDNPLARGPAKPTPDELRKRLIEQGWVDITGETMLVQRLRDLGSKSCLRTWRGRWNYSTNRRDEMAVAPRWAVAVGRYAPDRLKEAFAAKQLKRDALTFQLEAQHRPK